MLPFPGASFLHYSGKIFKGNKMKLITVTLSPVYDVFYKIPSFLPFGENSASEVSRFVGGKGLNVSRALLSYGVESTAVLLLGKENCDGIINEVNSLGLNTISVTCNGYLRENITVLSDKGETRINSDSFSCGQKELSDILDRISSIAEQSDIIICSGRFPKGLSEAECEGFVASLMKLSSRVALDTASLSGEAIMRLKPWLIKPNEHEMSSVFGIKVKNEAEAVAAAQGLCQLGLSNVMISLGKSGAVYCGELGCAKVTVPSVRVKSTVGAGDSTVGGFVYAYSRKMGLEDSLKTACAFGTAACLTKGTTPPSRSDIDAIKNEIKVRIL